MPITPHLPLGVAFMTNLVSSFQAFLDTNLVSPYNTAVTSTTYSTPIQILMHDPDDYLLESKVPALVLEDPICSESVPVSGLGDGLLWNTYTFTMNVYPALSTDAITGAQKPILESAYILRGLCQGLRTSLGITLIDFTTTPSPTDVDVAFVTGARIIDPKGNTALLGLLKHKFIFQISIRFLTQTISVA